MIVDLFLKNNSEKASKTDVSKDVKTDKGVKSNQENMKRSLAKTISWRVIGTLDTMLISYLITGTLAMAISIGGIELVSKMGLYFFHERAWNKIKWGN